MKRTHHSPSCARFEPFAYRGWSFVYCCVPDEQGRFRPVVFSELYWPGGLPVVESCADAFATTELAKRHARKIAMAWVNQRTCAVVPDD